MRGSDWLRSSPFGKALALLLVIAVALFVARGCGKTATAVSQDRAVEIAKAEVTFEPNDVRIRLLKRGFSQTEYWLVGLGLKNADGAYVRATNVLVDANSGEVADVENTIGGT